MGAPSDGGRHFVWLSSQDVDAHAGHSPGSGPEQELLIPGTATVEELSLLRSSSGPERDVFFLQLMLRHHESGEAIIDYGYQLDGAPAVSGLANRMLHVQATESDRMRELLAERNAGSITE